MRYTKAIINLKAITQNLQIIKNNISKNTNIMAVVKANGYGHGAVEVAKTAINFGCSHLAVALPQEAIILRQAGINTPILVLGIVAPEELAICLNHNLILTISSSDNLQQVINTAKNYNKVAQVFLKVDTGMGRIGSNGENLLEIATTIKHNNNLDLLGLFTHFASSGGENLSFAKVQLERFNKTINHLKEHGINPTLISASASSAILNLPESHFNLVRVGIAMYGLYPSDLIQEKYILEPALSLITRISNIKKVPANTPIGYEMTYYTKKDSYIATLPIGYADGYNRRLSNKSYVLIKGKRYKVAGNICMDQLMIDLEQDDYIKQGDEVVLIGKQYNSFISLEELAKLVGTINYELACNVSLRVPRIYQNEYE